ncbi:PepSY domain-containing protein [Citreimonas sp.]|uniref:PepSY domain-containing protein n=1 Tax=Citreimonas sp. TaxID=3036715 RepID=UPI004058F7CD
MKRIALLLAVMAGPAMAGSHAVDQDTVERIMARLAEMECQMAPDDIEMEDGGYDLDDVICKGGNQFDIMLDADLNEVSRRAE